ncbi:hypothetical protein B0H10DRAFT_2095207, partial [Mycena sp. CBHHK59/15]
MIPFSLLFCPHVACSAQDVYSKGHDRRLMTRQMRRGMQFPPYDFHPGTPRRSLDAASPYPTCLPASSLLYASLIQPRRFNGLPHIDPSTAPTVRSPPGALTVCLVSG